MTEHEHDRANAELIRNMLLAYLRQQFGLDNVDRYEDDEWRIGVSCDPGNIIDVVVTPTVALIGTTCDDCGTHWPTVFDLTEHKDRWCRGRVTEATAPSPHVHSWRVEGDDEIEPYHTVCEDCGAPSEETT